MRVVEKRQLLSAEEMERTLQRLAREIVEKSGKPEDLALIGVRRRGAPLADRLARTIREVTRAEIPVGILDIALYRDDLSTVGPQPVVHSTEISFPVDDRDLVLVDRGHRELPIEAAFVGRKIATTQSEIVEVRLREVDAEERVMLVDRVE